MTCTDPTRFEPLSGGHVFRDQEWPWPVQMWQRPGGRAWAWLLATHGQGDGLGRGRGDGQDRGTGKWLSPIGETVEVICRLRELSAISQ